jgi:hypothetical protein
MLFAPITYTRRRDVTATVINVSPNSANEPGYNLWGAIADNTANAAISYVQIFNSLAANVTLGTTVADIVIPVQGNGTVNFLLGPYFIFNLGLSIAVTTTKDGLTAPVTAIDVTPYYEEK